MQPVRVSQALTSAAQLAISLPCAIIFSFDFVQKEKVSAMDLKKRLEDDLKTALKAGKKEAVAAYRLTLSDILAAEKEKREPLDEKEAQRLLRSAVKKRKESIALFEKGGRSDLVEKEKGELGFLEELLPAGMSTEELSALVDESLRETGASSMKDLGQVMKWIMPRLEGGAEGSEVSRLVKEKLTRPSREEE